MLQNKPYIWEHIQSVLAHGCVNPYEIAEGQKIGEHTFDIYIDHLMDKNGQFINSERPNILRAYYYSNTKEATSWPDYEGHFDFNYYDLKDKSLNDFRTLLTQKERSLSTWSVKNMDKKDLYIQPTVEPLDFGDEKFRLVKSILADGEYQPQVDFRHPDLVNRPQFRAGAYFFKMTANNMIAEKYYPFETIHTDTEHPNMFEVWVHRQIDPISQNVSTDDSASFYLRYEDVAHIDSLTAFQAMLAEKALHPVTDKLEIPELLNKDFYKKVLGEIQQKKVRLECAFPGCKVALPQAQSIFNTWTDPSRPLLVLPPGFQDDTVRQMHDITEHFGTAGDPTLEACKKHFAEHEPFYQLYPCVCNPRFAGTGRVVELYEQQLPATDPVPMRVFADPHIPSVQYLTSENNHLDMQEFLCDVSVSVKKDVERVEKYRFLRNGRFRFQQNGKELPRDEQKFLETLCKELQPCLSDDLTEIENAVTHAAAQAILHETLELDVVDYIKKYAPIPSMDSDDDFEKDLYASKIMDRALHDAFPDVNQWQR